MTEGRKRAAPTRRASGTYTVQNPRGIPDGRVVVKVDGVAYRAGETVRVSGDKMDIDRFVKQGFIKRD